MCCGLAERKQRLLYSLPTALKVLSLYLSHIFLGLELHFLGLELFELTLVALAAFLGHVYPIFFGFKGGKGVATFIGALLALNYLVGLSFALTWLFVAKVLKNILTFGIGCYLINTALLLLLTSDLNATYVIGVICIWIFSP